MSSAKTQGKTKKRQATHAPDTKPTKKRLVGNNAKTAARMVRAAEKQRQAIELRKSGAGYDQIARMCGYRDRSGAYKAVTSGLKAALQEPAEELRQLEIERLDGMLVAISPQVRKGDYAGIDRALKIGERRAALLGLDAPTRIDSRIDVTKLSDAELDEYIATQSGDRRT